MTTLLSADSTAVGTYHMLPPVNSFSCSLCQCNYVQNYSHCSHTCLWVWFRVQYWR